jgi:hypothetical protein
MDNIMQILKKIFHKKRQVMNRDTKNFCISMQRNGTTSVGKFFYDFHLYWAGWPISYKHQWGDKWYNGDFEQIFKSKDFIENNAFEDGPWFAPEFYKILFHRFPNSKFILFKRESDKWWNSMISHTGGKILGNPKIHCKLYRREKEYYHVTESLGKNATEEAIKELIRLEGYKEHYINIYELYNKEVELFFNSIKPESLFISNLTDPDKWIKLGKFLNLDVPKGYDTHENKSK